MNIDALSFKDQVQLALKTLRRYQEPNNKIATFQILNSFGPFLILWVLIYNLWDVSKLAVLGLSLLNAFFLVRIFIIQHDCGHQSFVGNKKVRDIIGYFCSLMSGIPYVYWAKSHHFHHQHNGMLEVRDIGDLDTLTVKEYNKLSKWKRFWYRIYRSPLMMFFIIPIYYMFIHNRLPLINLPEFKKVKPHLWAYNIIYAAIIIGICFLLDWKKFLILQFIVLTLFGIIAIWFFYIQHQHEHGYKHWRDNWEFMQAAIKGSSYYKLPSMFNWLTGNIAIHHIHHLNPAIPNYNLKKCVEAIPWFNKHATQITFLESLKLATHKLWDESTQRMITFREYYRLERSGSIA